MSESKAQRKSFRVLDTVYLQYDEIDERTFKHGIGRWKLRQGNGAGFRSSLLDIDARLKEKLLILATESATLAEALNLLNTKIDALIEEFPQHRESKVALAQQNAETCEIGANGMLFTSDRQFPDGTKLVLRFLLAADSRYFETFATVVRTTEAPHPQKYQNAFGTAVAFNAMHSAQRDAIVQHLFDRESETLRLRRLQLESG